MDISTTAVLAASRGSGKENRYRLSCTHGVVEAEAPAGCDGKTVIDALVLGHSTQYGGCDCVRRFVTRFGIPKWLAEPPEDATERERVLAILAGDQTAIAAARTEQAAAWEGETRG